jgi:ribosomal protein S18 acetylase RimI-like enzyme
MERCQVCRANAQYRDRATGEYVCLSHARLEVTSTQRSWPTRGGTRDFTLRPATEADTDQIEALSLHFWEETEVDCFDRQYDVTTCPAFVACARECTVGLASYALEPTWNAAVLVMLNVLPHWQGQRVGHALVEAVGVEAMRQGLGRVVVVTSNDDLPALAFYQRHGFRITGIVPGRIAEHHGGEVAGFAGLPVRDEIRLERVLR